MNPAHREPPYHSDERSPGILICGITPSDAIQLAISGWVLFHEHPVDEPVEGVADVRCQSRVPRNGCRDWRRHLVIQLDECTSRSTSYEAMVAHIAQCFDLRRGGAAVNRSGNEATPAEIHVLISTEGADGSFRFATVEDHPRHHCFATALAAYPPRPRVLCNTRNQFDVNRAWSLARHLMVKFDEVSVGRQIDTAYVLYGEVAVHTIITNDEPVSFVS